MIKVIIERRIMPGLEEEYELAAREAMRVSLGVRGFVGGETLVELGHTDRRLMITKWRNLRAWKEWHSSEARAAGHAEHPTSINRRRNYPRIRTRLLTPLRDSAYLFKLVSEPYMNRHFFPIMVEVAACNRRAHSRRFQRIFQRANTAINLVPAFLHWQFLI